MSDWMMVNRKRGLFPFLIVISTLLLAVDAALAQSSVETDLTPTPTEDIAPIPLPVRARATSVPTGMGAAMERLAAPEMSDPPTQVELGRQSYHLSCMVCHGDRGQGLTPEWRSILDPADRNCWQSKCHAPNHPPEGFEIPRTSPAIMGTGSLASFQTAADLFAYLRESMPWPFPGIFEDDVYWNLTAHLVDANGIDYGGQTIGPENASHIVLKPELVQTHRTNVGLERGVTAMVIVLLMGTTVLYRSSQLRS
jgi:hypothetical protein